MSNSVEELAAMLMAAAIKEGRNDYVQALKNLVPVKESLAELLKDPEQFDETWKGRLLRTSYAETDVAAMFEIPLLKNPRYVEFTAEAVANVLDKSTQFSMIKKMLGAGIYATASKAVESLADVADFATWLATQKSTFSRANKKPYLYTIGEEKAFTREAAILFDKLGLEPPDDFDGEYRSSGRQWSESKFDAVVDWVSELAVAPRAEVDQAGDLTITRATLVKAFQDERQRVMSKGEWHQNVFPQFVPVIAGPTATRAMSAKGCIQLAPEYGTVGKSADGRDFIAKPSHNFVSTNHPEVNAEQIAAAMTLLSYDEITALRASGADDHVFLIPADTDLNIDESEPVSETLRIAMRYHRPEYLCSRYKGNITDFDSAGLTTRAYLRGVPASSELNRSGIRIHWEILSNPKFLRAFNSPQELALLQEILDPHASSPLHARLAQPENSESIIEQVEFAATQYESLIAKIGFPPAMLFKGTEVFLMAFADELTRRGLEISSSNTTRFSENRGGTSNTSSQRRLDARLGLLKYSPLREMPMEELLTKGSRLKGDSDKTQICGILDRLGVLGVANLAKTPSQRKFVIENFDVQSHYRDLPKAFRLVIGGQRLEDDLGM